MIVATKLNDDHSNAGQVLAECAALDEAYASAGEAEGYDRDLLALMAAAEEVTAKYAPTHGCTAINRLRAALEQFQPWLEQDDDPRSMGWVDDKGRP